jgi:hypothetical protein
MPPENEPATPVVTDPPAPAPAVVPAPTGVPVNMTSDLLKVRLDEARTAAERKVLRDLGVADIEAAKATLAAAKAAEEAQLSDAQKYQRTVDELRPRAERASALEQRVAAYAQREMAGLSEAARAAVTKHAGEDPERILATIEMFRDAGLIGGTSIPLSIAPAPAPANTASPNNAPRPTVARTKFDEWNGMSGMARDIFYGLHKVEIEKTRPAGQ